MCTRTQSFMLSKRPTLQSMHQMTSKVSWDMFCDFAVRARSIAEAGCLFALGIVELLLVELVRPNTLYTVSS